MLFNGVFLFLAFVISLFHNETSMIPLLYSSLICLIFGAFPRIFIPKTEELSLYEGITIVVLAWVITCIVGMIPYIMWGGEFSLINAWFESVSGFTTTGSTILNDIESLPMGLLFWRSSTHWIGGIGIILFILLILPQTSESRTILYHTEISDLSRSSFKYRSEQVIRILALVYFGLTVLEIILLKIAGMSLFDAVNHAFATIATGGFSTKNASIAAFNNPTIEIIIMVFMVLAGIHFGLLFATITGKRDNIFNSDVVRAYLLVMLIGIGVVTFNLYLKGSYDLPTSMRYASFQVISLGTTTGFASADSANWPSFSVIVLIYFTIQCAMVGSTSGGLKFDRIFLFFKSLSKRIKLIQHPKAVIALKISGKQISETLENQTMVFIIMYLFILLATTILVSLFNVDTMTSFSASAATLGNVGPGFGEVSSLGNFANLPAAAKFILTLNMLLGRLEMFSIIVLLIILRPNSRFN
ncbi:MAG: TrkH family potassium uptake protein [Bacteroidetes bacterium]|nr:TrkH family potassium uptake protein [Bacteroidota bacterium]